MQETKVTQTPLTPGGTVSTPAPVAVKGSKLATFSWALYDLANTVFSAAIVSIYFPAWVKDEVKVNDIWYALPMSLSMLLVGLFSPYMGSLTDRGGNRLRWLLGATVLSIGALFLMGVTSAIFGATITALVFGIALFVVANAAYQGALMFYDALLPSVSTPKNWGKVSGLGVGFGYFGGIIGFIGVAFVVTSLFGKGVLDKTDTHIPQNSLTFIPTAVLYLLFSVPCFLFVREKPTTVKKDAPPQTFRQTLSQTWRTFMSARQHNGLFIFLVANFFYSDAVNTVITAMGIYSTQVIGFTSTERNLFLAFSTIFAVVGSFAFGFLTDRLGAKQSLNLSLGLWVVVFIGAIAAPPPGFFFWVLGPLAGIALGSTWVAARVLMIELTPPDRLGEFLGLYNLTGKFSAVLGPAIWGITLFLFDPETQWGNFGYQLAVGMLLVLVLVGFALHQRVPQPAKSTRDAYEK